jgi:hypothetical protein
MNKPAAFNQSEHNWARTGKQQLGVSSSLRPVSGRSDNRRSVGECENPDPGGDEKEPAAMTHARGGRNAAWGKAQGSSSLVVRGSRCDWNAVDVPGLTT